MEDFLEGFNPAQREAVEYCDGPSLVIAGAGSGKTRVLTYKIAWLMKELGYEPWSILALTFTNKAADEMKQRVAKIVGDEKARMLWMGTFHSVFLRILRAEYKAIGFESNFTIYDAADSKSLVKAVMKEMELDDKQYKPGNVLSRISNAKNQLVTAEEYVNNMQNAMEDARSKMPKLGEIFLKYSQRLKQANAMDFDDILVYTYVLFAKNELNGNGFFFLKEAPSSSTQLSYTGSDFICDFADFMVVSPGISANDITPSKWTRVYGCVIGLWHQTELSALTALRSYQKQLRLGASLRDEMIMLNTWGDRSQDAKINENFCLAELERAKRLGITVFQLDDGWQTGKSPNSKMPGGSFKDIWKDSLYWTPDKRKFPHGLKPIIEKARKLGIRIGLWFNPSIQNNFTDWQKDANAVISLYREYGIDCFKIDGIQIPNKQAESNLRCLFEKISEETDHKVIFNLDATAGRRGGYHMLNEYGNIFLENRYTDWGNYYPYRTLRNLWELCRYVPAEKIQIEFLNKWRNASKYHKDDIFAPANYDFDYLFAITMAAQPLAWMEAANLPEEAFETSALIKSYKSIQHDIHRGIILPIGNEPSGRSWTGFQSITNNKTGYFIVFREDNEKPNESLRTFLPEGEKVNLKLIAGNGESFVTTISENGHLRFKLPQKNQFSIYKYNIIK